MMRADVFQSFPRRKFRQSASDPPRTDADCRGINLVRRVRGGVRGGNFYSAKNKICRIPRRRQSDPLAPIRTQADSIGVRSGIVPPPRLPTFFCHFLADRPPVDGGSDRIRSDPRRTRADLADFFGVRLSPLRRTLWRTGWRTQADPIGSDRIRSDPPRIRRGLSPPIIAPNFQKFAPATG